MTPTDYFNRVAASARKLWEQLDADPVLKGPWRQLFAQVQSPRHVLARLLQNAEHARAKSLQAQEDSGKSRSSLDSGNDASLFLRYSHRQAASAPCHCELMEGTNHV